MLVGAAADRWNVDPSECEAADSLIINGARTFTFAELAEEAPTRTPPLRPELRPAVNRAWQDSRCSGSMDPQKRTAACALPATFACPTCCTPRCEQRARAGSWSAMHARWLQRTPGIRHVAARDNWIAVVADNWWTAEQALKAANPTGSAERAGQSTSGPCF